MQIRTLLAGSAMLAVLAGCATGTQQAASPQTPAAAEQAAVYEGTLPCRNCAGIDITVALRGDEQASDAERTFKLDAAYREHPQNPPDEHYEGQWDVLSGTATDPDATVYELTPDGEGQVYYFLKLDPDTLELVDPQKRRFQNGEALRLTREQGQVAQ
ncbi:MULTISPECIES: copper resistance protein NlpE N-terminal domain-containing protein [unclassified Modicisalibacter]|uniref:copper resistance protein NlpE N-terminal domain-containing protein n=1 Tax=unclassified Modicisalibacter TaxID=2679913 RepID=UPI001CC9D1F5|nr:MULTISPECIES: copper resistance protein NlpE N-terminal domain-containing protein [unclassified Modicisalibacter]MBZ9559014.1 copper resistance protein NlpE N-terminal domain-containing protein [Modicisalibacter sp. R2A 31.J]MBZ9576874.1 copper resistance protein NlpE N-terminal domain-containing protein [Modicisalibacter sp. MOD 31.J]